MSLDSIRAAIENAKAEGKHEVAALIIEPMFADGGEIWITDDYAQKVRALTKELGVYLIVDEVQTGKGTTGKHWAHEYWELDSPPDFVTFAKKSLVGGFFYNEDTVMLAKGMNESTFGGDPVRVMMLAAQNECI